MCIYINVMAINCDVNEKKKKIRRRLKAASRGGTRRRACEVIKKKLSRTDWPRAHNNRGRVDTAPTAHPQTICIHTYIHAYMHTCIHTYAEVFDVTRNIIFISVQHVGFVARFNYRARPRALSASCRCHRRLTSIRFQNRCT